MISQQRFSMSKFKFSPRSRTYFFFSIGITLTGLILLISSDYSMNYSAYGGFVNRFGWDNDEGTYHFLNWGTIPQGLKGQKIDVLNRFTEDTDSGFGLHILLMHGREDILQDEYGDWQTDITFEDLSLEAMSIYNFTFDIQKTQRSTISLPIPSDNAYIIIFAANSFSISGNLTGTLIVDNYYLYGQDIGAMLIGVGLAILGILIGGATLLIPIVKTFIQRNQISQPQNRDFTHPSLISIFREIKSLNKDSKIGQKDSDGRSIQGKLQIFLILIKYEFQQVFGGPFIIGFLPMVALIIIERFREVFKAWEPLGGNIFGEFGTTISTYGVSLYIIEFSIGLVFTFLFLFREFDEGLHKVRLALPFSRKGYILAKISILFIFSMFFCFAFVGSTFVFIPLRNPTIGFQPITLIWAPFLAYGILSFVLSCLGFFIALVLKNSRNTVMLWLGLIVCWFYLSTDLQKNFFPYTKDYLNYPHLQESINSYFSIFVPERLIEFFLLRPLAPDWVLEDKLLYLHDTLINPIIIIGLQLLFVLSCIMISLFILRRRDL